MGKQINFYMCTKTQENFIKYLQQNNFIFLDVTSGIVNQPLSIDVFGLYLYKSAYGKIIMRKDNKENMDTVKSPVIQFHKTIINMEQKRVLRGRLWISDSYYNDEGDLLKKDKIFVKDYQMLTRWIKKCVPYQEIKKGEFFIKEYVNDELIELQENGFILTI